MKNEVQKYLESIIKFEEYKETSDDIKCVQIEGIEEYIWRKLRSTKFRTKSIPESLRKKIIFAIRINVRENKPIHISVPFGGYKKWQYPSAPHVDWAEVFNIIHLRNYVAPILKLYKPGVLIEYVSDEIFVERMNKISQMDLNLYNSEFSELCGFINKNSPNNFTIKLSKIRDSITAEVLHKRFDTEIEKLRGDWDKLDKLTQEMRIKKSERNLMQDLSNLSKKDKYIILKESTLVHDAFIFGDWEDGVAWAFEAHMIPVGFRYTGEWGISTSSAPGSAVQFWVGIGIFKIDENEIFHPRVLTYNQYLKIKDNLLYEEVDLNPSLPKKVPILPM